MLTEAEAERKVFEAQGGCANASGILPRSRRARRDQNA